MWFYQLFLTICLGEFIVYHSDNKPLKSLGKQKALEIHRRLLKVQWPTAMAYVNVKDGDSEYVNMFMDCLEERRSGKGNCSVKAANQLIKSEPRYRIQWIPDTIFQLAMLVSFRKERILLKGDQAVVPAKYGQKDYTDEINSASSFQAFLTKSLEYEGAYDELFTLVNSYYGKCKGRSDWETIVDEIMADFKGMRRAETIMVDDAKAPFEGSYKQWLDPGYAPIVKAYLREELEAAERNEFLLSRGNKSGLRLIAHAEGKDEHIHAFDFPSFRFSLSFGQRIFDGSMLEFRIPGARSLTYLYDIEGGRFNQGYLLRLSIGEYLVALRKKLRGEADSNLTAFNIFYVPPLSAIGGIFSYGEVFHARTKLGRSGFKGGFEDFRPRALMRDDRFSQFGIFREQDSTTLEFMERMLKYLAKARPIISTPEYLEEFKSRIRGQERILGNLKRRDASFDVLWEDGGGSKIFSKAIPEPSLPYNRKNIFHRMMKGEVPRETPTYYEDDNVLSIGDIKPLVHTHVLVMPKGRACKFVQFWDLMYYGTDQQLVSFFRGIHATVENATNIRMNSDQGVGEPGRDLVKHGYRMVINNYGLLYEPNYAGQSVTHLVAHIGGGETLAPVLKKQLPDPHKNYCATASRVGWGFKSLYNWWNGANPEPLEVKQSKELSDLPAINGMLIKRRVVEYRDANHPKEVIFELTDAKGMHLYHSIHDFCERAAVYEIRSLGEAIIKMARERGALQSGFRLYSNHGIDAHAGSESHFQMHLTLGSELGPTLANCRNE